MNRLYDILDALIGIGYKSYDQPLTVNLINYSSTWTNPSWGYRNISRPAEVPTGAWPELIKGAGAFLVPLDNEATPYRLMMPGGTAGAAVNVTIRWHWRVS